MDNKKDIKSSRQQANTNIKYKKGKEMIKNYWK